jgi:hypothetical protein
VTLTAAEIIELVNAVAAGVALIIHAWFHTHPPRTKVPPAAADAESDPRLTRSIE